MPFFSVFPKLFSGVFFLLALTVVPAISAAFHVKLAATIEEKIALSTRWDLGYYLFQVQEYGAAVREFEKIRIILPGDPTLLALIGSCYSMSGEWEKGEQALLEAKDINPRDEDITALLGQFYLSTAKPLKAAVYLEQTLKLSPDQADLHGRLAAIYLDAGQFERAQVHLETLLAVRGGADFGEPAMDQNYARCLAHRGRFREALEYAFRAHNAEPSDPGHARVLGLCLLGVNRHGEAARMLGSCRRQFAADAELNLQLGQALFLDRRWEEAEAAWLAGLRKHPDSYVLLSRLLEFYIQSARPSQAGAVLHFAKQNNPAHPGNLLLEAKLNRKLGIYTAAGKSLGRLKRQACGSLVMEALWEEAQLAYETGKSDACVKALDRLIASKYRAADAHLLKARLALLAGNHALAQYHILAAREINPYNLKIYDLARQAFSGAGERDKLAGLIQEGLALMPEAGVLNAYADRVSTAAP